MMMCLENSGENKATKKEIAFAFVALAFGSVIFFSGLEAAFLRAHTNPHISTNNNQTAKVLKAAEHLQQ